MEHNELLNSFLTSIDTAVTGAIKDKLQFHREYLDTFFRHTERFFDHLSRPHDNHDNNDIFVNFDFWSDIDGYLEETSSLIEPLDTELNEFTEETVWSEFDRAYNGILTSYPETLTFEVPVSFWQPVSEDRFTVRVRKSLIRSRIALSSALVKSRNAVLRLFRLRPRQRKPIERVVYARLLFGYCAGIPLRQFMLERWQLYFQLRARHLNQLHESCETVKNLLIQSFTDAESVELAELMPRLRENLAARIAGARSETELFLNELTVGVEELSARLSEDIGRYWNNAGTFMFPAHAYDAENTEKLRMSQNKSLKKIKKAWISHFSCECDEWRKDMDLSRLQVGAMKHCAISVGDARRIILDTVIPVITGSDRFIEEVEARITNLFGTEGMVIPEAVVDESNELVRTLRYEHIPRIIDTIHAAGLETILLNYHENVRNVCTILRDSYCIFIKRDFEHLPPHPETETVPYHEMVNEFVIGAFTHAHTLLLRDLRIQVETALRNLSDIDQILEFSIETALNLARTPNRQTSENPRHVLAEGITRTHGRIDDLVGNFRQLNTQVSTRLIDMTRTMSDTIQEIEDNEKLLGLKLRLTRARTRQEIIRFYNSLRRTIRIVVPISFRYAVKIVARTQHVYRRFRKITRLEIVSGYVDEQIAQYLRDTQQKIATLPYIYQRLFSLDPIVDRRFFAGQDIELVSLSDSFSRWREDRNVTVAVVGERGSGKTTFLNIA